MPRDQDVLGVDVLDQRTQVVQRLNRVDSLVPHMRNVEVAGYNRADLLVQSLQCHRVVDHVAAMHLETERHTVVRSDLPVLAPVWEQALLPLPLQRITQKGPLGECHPVWGPYPPQRLRAGPPAR